MGARGQAVSLPPAVFPTAVSGLPTAVSGLPTAGSSRPTARGGRGLGARIRSVGSIMGVLASVFALADVAYHACFNVAAWAVGLENEPDIEWLDIFFMALVLLFDTAQPDVLECLVGDALPDW